MKHLFWIVKVVGLTVIMSLGLIELVSPAAASAQADSMAGVQPAATVSTIHLPLVQRAPAASARVQSANQTIPEFPMAWDVSRTRSMYFAQEQGTGTTYTGTLKEVVESAVADLKLVGGGSIFFAAGDFDLGPDHFELDNVTDVTFAGQGIDVTILRNDADALTDTEPFDFVGSDRLIIRDMTISAGGPPRTTSDALDFDGGDDILIERIKIINSRGRGIVFDGKDDPLEDGGTAVRNVVRDCIIMNVPMDGIHFLASSHGRVEGCHISHVGGRGIDMNRSSSSADQPLKPSNDNVVISNRIEHAGSDGIRVHGGSRNTISDNLIINSGLNGIYIHNTVAALTCDDNIVEFNTSTDTQAVKTQNYGLSIASASCRRTIVGDNNLIGNLYGNINDLGTDTIYSASDKTPPSVPEDLQVTELLTDSVSLAWHASQDNVAVAAYEIFRNGDIVAAVSSETNYSDAAVAPATAYTYEVHARDAAGNPSDASEPVNVRTKAVSSNVKVYLPFAVGSAK